MLRDSDVGSRFRMGAFQGLRFRWAPSSASLDKSQWHGMTPGFEA